MRRIVFAFIVVILCSRLCLGLCLDQTQTIPDYSAFVWNGANTNISKRSSYNEITYVIPSKSNDVESYIELLMSGRGFQKINYRQKQNGDFILALSNPSLDLPGFPIQVDQEKINCCHILLSVSRDTKKTDNTILVMCLCHGLEVVDTLDRSDVIMPPATSALTINPASTDDPQTTGEPCWKCHGERKLECGVCEGSGILKIWVSTPGYGGTGTGYHGYVEKDCTNCENGYVDCPYCRGTGTIK